MRSPVLSDNQSFASHRNSQKTQKLASGFALAGRLRRVLTCLTQDTENAKAASQKARDCRRSAECFHPDGTCKR